MVDRFGFLPPVVRRIAETIEASRQGEVLGRSLLPDVRDSPGPVGQFQNPMAILLAAQANALGLGFEGLGNVGKAATGAGLAATGKVTEISPLARILASRAPEWMTAPQRQALQGWEAGGGLDPVRRAMQANEAGASGNEITTGILNELLNPANAADVARGGILLAQKAPSGIRGLGRLARDLSGLDPARGVRRVGSARSIRDIIAQAENIDPVLGPDLPPVLGPDLPPELGPDFPSFKAPRIGKEKLGPQLPPVQGPGLTPEVEKELFGIPGNVPRTSPRLGPEVPLEQGPPMPAAAREELFGLTGNVPPRDLIPGVGARVGGRNPQRLGLGPLDPGLPGLGREATGPAGITDLLTPITPEPAAPGRRGRTPARQKIGDLLAAEGARGWEELNPTEIETLVSWAYPNEEAISNAYLKYRNPADLAARAYERIGQLPRASFDQFARSHPDLARKVAYLPAPGEQDLARQLADEDLIRGSEVERIQAGPYAAVFEYFDDLGRLKRNPRTGKNIPARAREDLGEVLGRPGWGLDEIADTVLSNYYGDLDARIAAGVRDDEFWRAAQEEFLRFKELTAKPPVDELGFTPQGEYVGVPKGRRVSPAKAGLPGDPVESPPPVSAPAPVDNRVTLYHGSPRTFDPGAITPGRPGMYGSAISLTDNLQRAQGYARELGTEGKVYEYLSKIENPIEISDLPETFRGVGGAKFDELFAQLRDPQGNPYDAVVDERAGNVFVYDRGKLEPVIEGGEVIPPSPSSAAPETFDQDTFLLPEGGGGKSGILPGAPSRGRMTLQTAGLGGLGGYAAGEDEDPEDERNAALFGAALGGAIGGTAGSRFGQAAAKVVPALWRNGVKAQREALASGRGASLGDIGRVWKTQTTSTIRNLLQDEMVSRVWLARAGVRQEVMNENWYSMVDLYERGIHNPYEAQPERTRAILDRIGLGPVMGPTPGGAPLAAGKDAGGYVLQNGSSLSEANDKLVKALRPLETAKIEAGLSVLSPLNAVPGLGVALGAAKGLTRPMWTEIFQSVNRFTHAAARDAVWQESVIDDLAALGGSFIRRDPRLARLPADGLFTPDEVLRITGDQGLADEWANARMGAVKRAETRAKQVFGDFSNEKWWERGLGMAVPFASWGLRAYPRTIGMLAEHPGITMALLAWVERDAQRAAEEGRPGYQVGNVTLNKDTPVLGKILGGMTAGKEGDLRVNLLGALTPFSGEAFAVGEDEGEEKTLYQNIKGQVARTGFSFNPFIVGLAYALNWDYMRPGAMSRTAGIEQSLPGPEIPSFMQGPLDFVRSANGGNVSQVTPEERRWGQNLYEETGYSASAPQNADIAAASNLPGDSRMAQAEREVGQGGLVKNLVSLLSPVSMTAETDTARYARQSADYQRANPAPVTDPATMIGIRQANPLLALILEDQDRARQGEGSQINRGVDRESRAYAALEAWERENAALAYFQPSVYRVQKAQLREALGIPPER